MYNHHCFKCSELSDTLCLNLYFFDGKYTCISLWEYNWRSMSMISSSYDTNVLNLRRIHNCYNSLSLLTNNQFNTTNPSIGNFFMFQHLGRSVGGGKMDSFGPFPFFTTNAIFNPHVVCTSRWQWNSQTPASVKSSVFFLNNFKCII